jgi:hypothetical protein
MACGTWKDRLCWLSLHAASQLEMWEKKKEIAVDAYGQIVTQVFKEDISCAITHFSASVQSNYPEHPI